MNEGQEPSPSVGHTLALPTGRQATGGEGAPSILDACGFAPGGWLGKEGLWPVMFRWLSLKVVNGAPGHHLMKTFPFSVTWELVRANPCPTLTCRAAKPRLP